MSFIDLSSMSLNGSDDVVSLNKSSGTPFFVSVVLPRERSWFSAARLFSFEIALLKEATGRIGSRMELKELGIFAVDDGTKGTAAIDLTVSLSILADFDMVSRFSLERLFLRL